jgi:hypothetical protein
VEPYPGVFARVKVFAEEAARRFQQFDLPDVGGASDAGQRQVTFLNRMAEIAAKLEMLAGKELAGEPFSDEDEAWLKRAVDDRVMGSGFTTYSGWYCDLFYAGKFSCGDWVPTVVDVHTDPNDGGHVLEQAVGSCNFLVMAIDQGDESMIYVGPSYSYYEFQQPASDRLTDDDWSFMLQRDRQPARPDWTSAFQAPALRRQSR